MSITIPEGTTHVMPPNEHDVEPKPSFFKWSVTVKLPEPADPMCCWHVWKAENWILDPIFADSNNQLVPVEQYTE